LFLQSWRFFLLLYPRPFFFATTSRPRFSFPPLTPGDLDFIVKVVSLPFYCIWHPAKFFFQELAPYRAPNVSVRHVLKVGYCCSNLSLNDGAVRSNPPEAQGTLSTSLQQSVPMNRTLACQDRYCALCILLGAVWPSGSFLRSCPAGPKCVSLGNCIVSHLFAF